MVAEIFTGNKDELLARLQAIIAAGPAVINNVIIINKGTYIILST